MPKPEQNSRITAARAFMESLDQLQNILVVEDQDVGSQTLSSSNDSSSSWTDLNALEDAVADLDAFFGNEKSPEARVDEENQS